jgi:hypothetical protein
LQKGQVGRYIFRPLATNVCVGGASWTERTLPNAERLRCIAYGAGVFSAGGQNSTNGYPCAVYSDDDGVTWNESTTSFSYEGGVGFTQYSMAFGNGVWLAGMHSINGWKSTDGIAWAKISLTAGISCFVYCTTRFVALHSSPSSSCHVTSTGAAFSSKTMPSSRTWSAVCASGDLVIAATSDSSYKTAVSTDEGDTWSAGGDLPSGYNARTMAYGNGVCVVVPVSGSSNYVVYSDDNGASWQKSNLVNAFGTTWTRVRFLQGKFLLLSQGGGTNYNSSDGITWSSTPNNVNMASFNIDFAGDDLGAYAAIGDGGSNTTVANSGVCTG